jgi:murein DD-endopeptidase MepM/ murein hydrolase activator NlpD
MAKQLIASALLSLIFVVSMTTAPDAQFGNRERDSFGRGGGGGASGDESERNRGNRPPPEIIRAFSPKKATFSDMKARGFGETGLEAIYPGSVSCLPIASPFASQTRHDGSTRSDRFFEGYHGGADISAPGGTPLIAIADGTVVRKHHGENIGGIGIFLQHAPADTGLKVWLYTEYKHLEEMPPLEVGQKVKMGEVIAKVGNTGTTGGRAYGSEGYYHLHWTAFYSDNPAYTSRRLFIPKNGHWLDPLAVFLREPLESKAIRKLPEARRKLRISYKATTGKIVPEGAKIIWPIACSPH